MDLELDGTAAVVARTMSDVLGTPVADDDQDFFLSGGDSVRAVELITLLLDAFPLDEEQRSKLAAALLIAVFDEATPRSLAAVVAESVGDVPAAR